MPTNDTQKELEEVLSLAYSLYYKKLVLFAAEAFSGNEEKLSSLHAILRSGDHNDLVSLIEEIPGASDFMKEVYVEVFESVPENALSIEREVEKNIFSVIKKDVEELSKIEPGSEGVWEEMKSVPAKTLFDNADAHKKDKKKNTLFIWLQTIKDRSAVEPGEEESLQAYATRAIGQYLLDKRSVI